MRQSVRGLRKRIFTGIDVIENRGYRNIKNLYFLTRQNAEKELNFDYRTECGQYL